MSIDSNNASTCASNSTGNSSSSTQPARRSSGRETASLSAARSKLVLRFLTLRDLETYAGTIVGFFSLEGVLAYAVALCGIKALHELGHGYIAKAQGARVPQTATSRGPSSQDATDKA